MSTQMIVGVLVIAVTVISSTEGIPRPQEFVEADGFVFDGPVDRSGSLPTTKPPPVVVPTFTPPLVTPSDTPTSSSTQTSVVPSPEVAQCIQNCRFRVTSEYNPVCGTDRTVYSNPGMLTCAKLCGHNVSLAYTGPCTSTIRG